MKGKRKLLCTALLLVGIQAHSRSPMDADAAKIRSMLENGGEWTVEWWFTKQGDKDTWSYKVRFVTQAGKFGADIKGHPKGDCFKEVILKSKGLTYTGCQGNPAEMRYDPSDPKYPFKGESSYTSLRFTQSP